ncbi:MAG: hypothetical protein Q4D79_10930 [Propionibacteriaceae bacterium]|nr:hypothetical protein [Propionibacteriaceae bacterium]
MGLDVREISADTLLDELTPKTLLVFPDRAGVLARFGTPGSGHWRVTLYFADDTEHRVPRISGQRPVGEVAATLAAEALVGAYQLPSGTVRKIQGRRRQRTELLVALLAFTLSLAMFAATCGGVIPASAVDAVLRWSLITLVAAVLSAADWAKLHFSKRGTKLSTGKPESVRFESRHLLYGFAELRPAREPDEDPHTIVDEVKAEYGKLLSDIAYRIEYPALFDAREPLTERLTLALFDWDSEPGRADATELSALANTIRSAFQAAREHAERIGMRHFPAEVRDQAATALQTAKVAGDPSATAAERSTALQHTIRLLDALALNYLLSPAEANEALVGGELKQLPGRLS